MLRLDQVKENALLWLHAGSKQTAEEDIFMRDRLSVLAAALATFAEEADFKVN